MMGWRSLARSTRETMASPFLSSMGKERQNLTLLMKMSSAPGLHFMMRAWDRNQMARPSRRRLGKP